MPPAYSSDTGKLPSYTSQALDELLHVMQNTGNNTLQWGKSKEFGLVEEKCSWALNTFITVALKLLVEEWRWSSKGNNQDKAGVQGLGEAELP